MEVLTVPGTYGDCVSSQPADEKNNAAKPPPAHLQSSPLLLQLCFRPPAVQWRRLHP